MTPKSQRGYPLVATMSLVVMVSCWYLSNRNAFRLFFATKATTTMTMDDIPQTAQKQSNKQLYLLLLLSYCFVSVTASCSLSFFFSRSIHLSLSFFYHVEAHVCRRETQDDPEHLSQEQGRLHGEGGRYAVYQGRRQQQHVSKNEGEE